MTWDQEQGLGVRVIRPEYMALAGDLATGLLLNQIVWWLRPRVDGTFKTQIVKFGHRWVAKTAEDWCKECGIGPWQYRQAIAQLKAKGIIHSAIMIHEKLTLLHIRLDLERLLALVNAHPIEGVGTGPDPVEAPPPDETSHPPGGNITPPLMKHPILCKEGIGIEQIGVVAQAPTTMATLKEVLEQKAKAQHHPEALWKSLVSSEFGGFQKPLTGKERAQLKSWVAWMTSEGLDPAKQMSEVLTGWKTIVTAVRAELGLQHVPEVPVVGWCLQYRANIANNLTPQSTAAPAQPVKAMTPEEAMTWAKNQLSKS